MLCYSCNERAVDVVFFVACYVHCNCVRTTWPMLFTVDCVRCVVSVKHTFEVSIFLFGKRGFGNRDPSLIGWFCWTRLSQTKQLIYSQTQVSSVSCFNKAFAQYVIVSLWVLSDQVNIVKARFLWRSRISGNGKRSPDQLKGRDSVC